MIKWNFYRISHSQKNKIDLYCRQFDGKIEVYITNADENNLKIIIHDILIGQLDDLIFDQYSNKINWELIDFNFDNIPCEFDMGKARERHGNMDNLHFLTYHIANSINSTHNNRGFSRYLKKMIVGKWKEKELTIDFNEFGEYTVTGEPTPMTTLIGVPNKGKYHLSSNMMLLFGENNFGVRTQIVDLIDNKIFFPGFSGRLFFIMTKE
jgi:hypothetical protein